MDERELWQELGQQLRVDAVRASAKAGSGHPTSSMSAADLAAVLSGEEHPLLARRGETISWSRYLRWGFTYTPPVLLATLAALAGWLWLIR